MYGLTAIDKLDLVKEFWTHHLLKFDQFDCNPLLLLWIRIIHVSGAIQVKCDLSDRIKPNNCAFSKPRHFAILNDILAGQQFITGNLLYLN